MTTADTNRSKTPRNKNTSTRQHAKSLATRNLVLDTTARLMLDEGYAAVSTRRVAKEAGLKAPLVHYHYTTTDDLLVALFRRTTEENLQKLDAAGSGPDAGLHIWENYKDHRHTGLFLEFMALANHRPVIRDEIAQYTNKARRQRAEVLARELNLDALEPDTCSAAGLAVLMIGVARTLVIERGLGISLGHDEATALVEWWLKKLHKPT